MNRAQATKLWKNAIAAGSPEERYPFLRRLESAKPHDVIHLTSQGRRRFDRDAKDKEGLDSFLFAAKRDGNRLLDGVEVYAIPARAAKVESIVLFAELTIARIPGRFFVKRKCTGQSGIAVGGWQHYLTGRVGSGSFIPELDRAIPRLSIYKRGSFEFRCIWTAEEAVAAHSDWVTQIQSANKAQRCKAILKPPIFYHTEFSAEARESLGKLVQPAVLEAFADADPKLRSAALGLINVFELENMDTAAIAQEHRQSSDADRRRAGFAFADYVGHATADGRLQNVDRKLADADRDIRFAALSDLRRFGFTLSASAVTAIIERRIPVETDDEVKAALIRYRLGHAPLHEPFVRELCDLIESSRSDELRRLAFTRLREAEGAHAFVAKTALEYFDRSPVCAADILIAAHDYSRAAKAKMIKLANDADWSLRWRAVLYLEDCPVPSVNMLNLIERLQADEEFTVRESATRARRALQKRIRKRGV